MDITKILNIVSELRQKLDDIENEIKVNNQGQQDVVDYVDLYNGDNFDKIKRITQQINDLHVNMLASPKDSQIVRSAIVAEFAEKGLFYWLEKRKFADDYNETVQVERYSRLLKYRDTNKMTFGAIVNRYKQAIDNFNNNILIDKENGKETK